MITKFPEFTPIADVTLGEFQQACKGFPPYSEFNHLTLRCYSPGASVSRLEKALILRCFEKQPSGLCAGSRTFAGTGGLRRIGGLRQKTKLRAGVFLAS